MLTQQAQLWVMGYPPQERKGLLQVRISSLEKHEENLDSITTGQVMLSQ